MPPPVKKYKGNLNHVNEDNDVSLNEGDFLDNLGLSSTPAGTPSETSPRTDAQNTNLDKNINQGGDSSMSDISKPSTSSSRKRPFGDTTHLDTSRSLFSSHVLNMPTCKRRSPSFDVEAFVKYKSKTKPQTSKTSNAPQSPFYMGKTMYGGASTAAYSLLSKELMSSIQKQLPIRPPTIQVEVIKPQESSLDNCMSMTARRILATIEDYAKPLHEQTMFVSPNKPALVQNIKRFGDEDRLLNRSREDRSPILARTPYSRPSNSSPSNKPFRRELQVATVPEMLRQLRTHKLQESTRAYQKIAMDYQLRTQESEKNETKSVNKMKAKVTNIRSSKNCADQEECAPVLELPSVQLQITNMPTFDIQLPDNPDHETKANSNKHLSVDLKKNTVNTNTIISTSKGAVSISNAIVSTSKAANSTSKPVISTSKPVISTSKAVVSTPKAVVSTPKAVVSAPKAVVSTAKAVTSASNAATFTFEPDEFKFSEPMRSFKPQTKLMDCDSFEFSEPKPILENSLDLFKEDLPMEDVAARANTQIIIPTTNERRAMQINNESNAKNMDTKNTLITDLPHKAKQTNKDKNDNDFQQLIKKQNSKWECTECLTRNDNDKTKCACCEALKPGTERAKPNNVLDQKCELPKVTNSFQDVLKKQNEKWACGTCMTYNENYTNKCICCQEPKPGSNLNNVTGSFQEIIQKQKQKWECKACFTRNDGNKSQCICCEAPKPGVAVEKPLFNFSSVPTTEFKFGIDKADAASVISATPASTNTNSQASTKTPGGFVFGMPKTQKCEKDKTTESETSLKSPVPAKETPAIPTASPFTFGIPPKPATTSAPAEIKIVNTPKIESFNLKPDNTKPIFQFGAPIDKPVETKPAVPVTFSIPSSVPTNNSTIVTSQASSTTNNSLFTFGSNAPISSTFNGGSSNIKSVNDTSPNPAKLSMFNTVKPSNTTTITSPLSFKTSAKPNEVNTDTAEPLSKKPIFSFNANVSAQNQPSVFGANVTKTLEPKEIKPKEGKFQFGSLSDSQTKPYSFAPKPTSNNDKSGGLFVFGSNGGTDSSTARSQFSFGSGQASTPGFAANKSSNTFGATQTTMPAVGFPAVAAPNTQANTSIFGSNTSSNTNTPAFNFVSNAAPPVQGSAVFTFGATKPSPAAPTAGFSFSAASLGAPQIPSLGSFGTEAKSSGFSFNMGTPGSQAATGARKIKKAVRRTQR